MDTKAILSEFDGSRGLYDDFRVCVENILRDLLRANGIRAHSIGARTKTRESLAEKLERDGKDGYECLSDVTDIVGVRVITHMEDEVDTVGAIVEKEFSVDRDNSVDKRKKLDPDRFGYLSLHYVASLNGGRLSLTENARFSSLKFEVQVRSILQHAWAEIEHDIGYKSDSAIPAPIRRGFSRIASLLEIADSEFIRIREDLKGYKKSVTADIARVPEVVSVDDVSISSFVMNDKFVKRVDKSMLAELPNGRMVNSARPNIAAPLVFAGLKSIEDVSIALDEYKDVVFDQWRKRILSQERPFQLVRRGISIYHLGQVLAYVKGGRDMLEGYLSVAKIKTSSERVDEISKIISGSLAEFSKEK